MKKSVMSVEAMIEMYLTYGLEEDTWDMMYHMANHGLISRENWSKFYEKCKDWAYDENDNVVNGEGKVLYAYDENGYLKKVA